jgi:hypothetical protein
MVFKRRSLGLSGLTALRHSKIATKQYLNRVCYVRPPLWSSGQSSWLQNKDVLCFL